MIQNRFGTAFDEKDDPFLQGKLLDMMIQNAYLVRTNHMRSDLDSRKDLNKECDYPETTEIQITDYQRMYDRSSLGARVVEVMPEECWQVSPLVYEDEDSETETDFEAALREISKTLRGEESWYGGDEGNPLWEYLSRADKLSGIGHYGAILLGIDDGKPLDQPVDGFEEPGSEKGTVYIVNRKKKDTKLLYMSVFGEYSLSTSGVEYETDRYSPRYRRPKYYHLDLGDTSESTSTVTGRELRTVRVHWTRVIHVCDGLGSSEVVGVPRMRPVWNHLIDSRKIYGASGEGYWRGAVLRMLYETNPQLGGDVEVDEESLRDAIWNMENGLQRWLLLKGLSGKPITPAVSDPTPHINAIIDAICIKLGIPVRIFKGSERGELASGQDDQTWNDRVRARRRGYLTPRLLIPLFDRLIQIGVLPEPGKEGYKVEWPDPEQLKPLEKATLAATKTDALVKYIGGGADVVVQPLDYLTRFLEIDEEEAQGMLDRSIEAAQDQQEEGQPGVPDQAPGGPGAEVPPGAPGGQQAAPLAQGQAQGQQSPGTQPAGQPASQAGEGQSAAASGGEGGQPALSSMPPLNGAQINAAKDILLSVSGGGTPVDVAADLLQAVGIPADRALRMATSASKNKLPVDKADKLQSDVKSPEAVKNEELCDECLGSGEGIVGGCKYCDGTGVANAFCPTGKGGGVDPTCSPKSGPLGSPGIKAKLDRMKSRVSAARSKLSEAYKARSKKGIQRGKRRLRKLYETLGRIARKYDDHQEGSGGFTTSVPSHGGYIGKFLFGGTTNQSMEDDMAEWYELLTNEESGLEAVGLEPLDNVFCSTGKGGGIDPTCGKGGGKSSAVGGSGIGDELITPPPPGKSHQVDVERDSNGDGVTDAARVGVPADEVPPPPKVPKLPNLTPHERAVEESFIEQFHRDPDAMAAKYREAAIKETGHPPQFGTDDAKGITTAWGHEGMPLEERSQNRATLNLALHQTANAVAKRAALQHMDTLEPGDEVMVTVGGCGAGKGFALKSDPEVKAMKGSSKMVWDSAGDQNATENTWVLQEAEKRGLKVTYVHVNADPKQRWADSQVGVVSRAKDPEDGRMVDAMVFADSYAIGNKNHAAFYEANKNNPNARFVFMDAAVPNPNFDRSKPPNLKTNPEYLPPQRRDSMPTSALGHDRDELAKFALDSVNSRTDVPPHIRRGATMGTRIWSEDAARINRINKHASVDVTNEQTSRPWWELVSQETH